MEKKTNKIKINDKRARNVSIIIGISAILLVILILVLRGIINRKLSKEISTEMAAIPQSIEWLVDDYKEIIDIEDIIQGNLNNQIKQVIEVQTVELEYQTEYRNNTSLPIGTVKVTQEGKDGEQELIIRKQYEGDVLIVDEQIGRRIMKPAMNKVIEIGVGSYYDIIYNNQNTVEYSRRTFKNFE